MKQLLDIAIRLGAFGLFAVAMLGFAFFAGTLFGMVGKGLSLDAVLLWLEKWQELVGAILGALVTGAAAFMIALQIQADDEREEKRERAARLKLAKDLVREAQRFMGVLAAWTALSELLLPLQLSDQANKDGNVIPPVRYDPTADVIIHNAEKRVLSPGRFDRFIHSIGDLDQASAQYFSDLEDELKVEKLSSEYDPTRAREYAMAFTKLQICGEALIDSLEAIIRNAGKVPADSNRRDMRWIGVMTGKWSTRVEVFRKHFSYLQLR